MRHSFGFVDSDPLNCLHLVSSCEALSEAWKLEERSGGNWKLETGKPGPARNRSLDNWKLENRGSAP
jgi:hypothetical protein